MLSMRAKNLGHFLLGLVLMVSAADGYAAKRVALVIGNSAYASSPLKNPLNDAKDITRVLEGLGFKVQHYKNLNRKQMRGAVREFGRALKRADIGLFYFAGHGMEVKDTNYLIPVGTDISDEDEVQDEAVSANSILRKMESAGNAVNIVVLDACRNNPLERSFRSVSRGLARMDAPIGSFLLYATAPGQVAADGVGRNGMFTRHLIDNLNKPGLTLRDIALQTRIAVMGETQRKQVPWEASSLTQSVVLKPSVIVDPVLPPAEIITPVMVPPDDTKQWFEPEMVIIPAGSYQMGDLSGKGYSYEKPVHRVELKSFKMSKYEVTFDEYDAYVKASSVRSPGDNGWGRGTRPVINVSWDDVKGYIKWLNDQTGKRYRLPSESEWEYAARAGSVSLYSWEDSIGSNRANCDGCGSQWDDKQTAPVGSFSTNAYGLFDMHGNVWEWVEDRWHESYEGAPSDGSAWVSGDDNRRVLRGGAWVNLPARVRSAFRSGDFSDNRDFIIGFRLAQDR